MTVNNSDLTTNWKAGGSKDVKSSNPCVIQNTECLNGKKKSRSSNTSLLFGNIEVNTEST